jgi:hypothetical protein
MTLQDEETRVDQEIVNELVGLVPQAWTRVVLEVKYSCDERGDGFEHSIYNPDGHRDFVEPSDVIYSATWDEVVTAKSFISDFRRTREQGRVRTLRPWESGDF